MYTTSQHPGQPAINTIGGDLDGSGTINPAALNNAGSVLPTPTSLNNASMQSPRGLKRSRSPEQFAGDAVAGVYNDNDDRPNKKRGRPSKERGPEDLILPGTGQPIQGQLPTPQTATHNQQSLGQHPQSASVQAPPPVTQQPQSIPTAAPKQASPAKPAGKTVVKALPTVRDHTTDQLNPENDEYIPRETDPEGEKKVMPNGRLTGNREYKCRTFLVPNRGDKLFMLATECARVLGYRDSYLLFNKNRSLYKIIATQAEKDDLIHQDILPYSYRSRQIAIVTARSMFRQFGSRVINNGRRVRDDYWEAKARKQGFTEEDLAGEKRPGAAKREAAAQEAAANAAAAHHTHHNDVIYSTPVDPHGQPMPMTYGGMMHANYHLPMINPHPGPNDDIRNRFDYTNIQRPKQDITGPAYQDKTQLSSMSEIMNQAGHTSDFNHALDQQRRIRGNLLKDQWKREQPVTSPGSQETAAAPAMSQAMQSPHLTLGAQQPMLQPQPGQTGYQQSAAAQGSPTNMRTQPPQRQASIPYASNQVPQSPGYAYPSHMWQQQAQQPPQAQQQHPNQAAAAAAAAQAQQSPVASQHNASQYSPQTPGHNQQHNQSPHPTQSPHNMHGQAGQHHQNPASMQPPPQMPSYQMPAMGMQQGYGNMPGRGMYQQPQQPHHSYMQQSGPGAAAGMAGWAAPPSGQQAWQGPSY